MGASWAAETVPSKVYSLDSISCPTSGNCMAVGEKQPPTTGTQEGAAVSVASGSTTWQFLALPSGTAPLAGVSCNSPGTCGLLTGDSLLTTTDGGATWSSATVPSSGEESAPTVSCPTSDQCVVSGFSFTYPTDAPIIESTSDSGSTWATSTIPSVLSMATGVSCPSTCDCTVVGRGTSGYGGGIVDSTTPFG